MGAEGDTIKEVQHHSLQPSTAVDTIKKIGYSDIQIYEENEHNCHGSLAQFCRLR
jgi:hypothetical protein